jgi:hypothetical protein
MGVDVMNGIPLDERCLTGNCGKIENDHCTVYQFPVKRWHLGCPMAKKEVMAVTEKKVNPLKASKRAGKK